MKKNRYLDPIASLVVLFCLFLGSVLMLAQEMLGEEYDFLTITGYSVLFGIVYFLTVLGLLLPPNPKGSGWGISGRLPSTNIPYRYLWGFPLFISVYFFIGLTFSFF